MRYTKTKKPEDEFVLSNGHAFLALAVVKEKYEGMDAEKLAKSLALTLLDRQKKELVLVPVLWAWTRHSFRDGVSG